MLMDNDMKLQALTQKTSSKLSVKELSKDSQTLLHIWKEQLGTIWHIKLQYKDKIYLNPLVSFLLPRQKICKHDIQT